MSTYIYKDFNFKEIDGPQFDIHGPYLSVFTNVEYYRIDLYMNTDHDVAIDNEINNIKQWFIETQNYSKSFVDKIIADNTWTFVPLKCAIMVPSYEVVIAFKLRWL